LIVCEHRPPCPGCPRLGAPDIDPGARAALTALSEENGLGALRVIVGPALGFRHRARLAVRGRVTSPKVGIFETGSHRVVAIPRCLVHHPLVNEVAREVRRAVVESRTSAYSDAAHYGIVRYVQIVVERRTTTAQVVVITNSETPAPVEALLGALRARLGERLHALFWNGNPARANRILGPIWSHITGPEAIEESMGGARVFYPPGAFGQNHTALAARLVDLVHEWVPDGARVLELYAGVGPIGLGLTTRVESVTFNEISGDSLRGLDMGVAALDPSVQGRVKIVRGAAALASSVVASSDVVVADPPRKGLDAEIKNALVAAPPRLFVYVACGLPSFLDDAAQLLASEKFRLAELAVFDMFPYTNHVEVAARFDRRD
jgi:tRNA/tmRNA/rRNA uracil-C5-methylase (TrmA/RlmC/RlmD family)